ncbi:ADP-ribosylhydrolase ARH1-like [Ptychodera flava]|uniref:ADP-ribosylhydrolase ARH1-like n=1 Tax=Ptychodera flava TaxID=63121 RepID=UPI00396A5969
MSVDAYKAAMVLSGSGDALGYKNQEWEYCTSGPQIHKELAELGGLGKIVAELPGWPISDDTVMHIATGEALATGKSGEDLFQELAGKYVECMNDMEGRKPGPTSMLGTSLLKPGSPDGYCIPFNPTGTGCGAAMRSMCIGLRYPKHSQLDDLIAASIESGRMTHHHPTGYLGSLASALFTAYSVQGKPLREWGTGLLSVLPRALEYVISAGKFVKENEEAWTYFGTSWKKYLETRGIADGDSPPKFPKEYGVEDRDVFYKTLSLDGWAGRSGHDAPMIAYDSLLACGSDWEKLCSHSMFHAGDSDSTGVIAACCWGVMHGFVGVPEGNYAKLEYRERLENLGVQLFQLSGL